MRTLHGLQADEITSSFFLCTINEANLIKCCIVPVSIRCIQCPYKNHILIQDARGGSGLGTEQVERDFFFHQTYHKTACAPIQLQTKQFLNNFHSFSGVKLWKQTRALSRGGTLKESGR